MSQQKPWDGGSQVPKMLFMGVATGAIVTGLFNASRHRPVMYRECSSADFLDLPTRFISFLTHFVLLALGWCASPLPSRAEPWIHLMSMLVGGYTGKQLGHFYDDTGAAMKRNLAGYASLPSWAYAQLPQEELGESALRARAGFVEIDEEAGTRGAVCWGSGARES